MISIRNASWRPQLVDVDEETHIHDIYAMISRGDDGAIGYYWNTDNHHGPYTVTIGRVTHAARDDVDDVNYGGLVRVIGVSHKYLIASTGEFPSMMIVDLDRTNRHVWPGYKLIYSPNTSIAIDYNNQYAHIYHWSGKCDSYVVDIQSGQDVAKIPAVGGNTFVYPMEAHTWLTVVDGNLAVFDDREQAGHNVAPIHDMEVGRSYYQSLRAFTFFAKPDRSTYTLCNKCNNNMKRDFRLLDVRNWQSYTLGAYRMTLTHFWC